MSEDAAERRKRLKALKEKATSKSIKFRNYRPQDAAIKQQAHESKGGGGANGGATAPSGNKGKGVYWVLWSGHMAPPFECVVFYHLRLLALW